MVTVLTPGLFTSLWRARVILDKEIMHGVVISTVQWEDCTCSNTQSAFEKCPARLETPGHLNCCDLGLHFGHFSK